MGVAEDTQRMFKELQLARMRFDKEKDRFLEAYRLFRGEHWEGGSSPIQSVVTTEDDYKVTVHLPYAIYMLTEAFTLARLPYIDATARGETSPDTARINESVLNYLVKEIDPRREVKLCLQDCYKYGFGVAYVGWQARDVEPEFEKKKGKTQAKEKTVHREHPWQVLSQNNPIVRQIRVGRGDFLYDALPQRITDATWMAHRVIMPFDLVKDDPRYEFPKDFAPKKNLSPGDFGVQAGDADEFVEKYGKDFKPVVLWHRWQDKKKIKAGSSTVELYILCEGVDNKPVFYNENPFAGAPIDTKPYKILSWNEDSDDAMPTSDVLLLRSQFYELDLIRTFMLMHIKRAVGKWLYEEGALTDAQVGKIKAGVDQAVVGVDRLDALTALFPQMMNSDVWKVQDVIMSDIRDISGVNEILRGHVTKGTATEVREAMAGVAHMLGRKTHAVEKFFEEILRFMRQLFVHFYDSERYWPIAGAEPEPVKPDILQQEIDVNVRVGSTIPAEKQQRQEMYMTLLQLTQENPNVNGLELLRGLIDEMDIPRPHKVLREAMINADKEIIVLLLTGKMPPVKRGQPHREHIRDHRHFVESVPSIEQQTGQKFPQEKLQQIVAHVDTHEAFLAGGSMPSASKEMKAQA